MLDQHPAVLEATMTCEVIIENYVLQCDISSVVSVKGELTLISPVMVTAAHAMGWSRPIAARATTPTGS